MNDLDSTTRLNAFLKVTEAQVAKNLKDEGVASYPIVKILSRSSKKLDTSLYFQSILEWDSYKEKHQGTFLEIASIWGFPSTLGFLSSQFTRRIFQYRRSEKRIDDLFS